MVRQIMNEVRCSVELRADDSRQSPGRLTGTLLVYEERALDRPEVFREGSLTWPDEGVILNVQHNRQALITRFTPTVEGRALKLDVPLPDTTMGRDAATMVRNGTVTGLSVEFEPIEEGRRGGLRELRRAMLKAAALVDSSSYRTTVEVRHGRRRRVWL